MALCLLVLTFAVSLSAEIVDRVAVSIGNQVITESELLREIRLTAFLGGEKPELSTTSKHKAAERLIEQKLIRKEMELGRDPQPTPAEAGQMLAAIDKSRMMTLPDYGLTREDLEAHLEWQAALLKFIDFRFRPAVRVTNRDIQQYYQQHFAAAPVNKATLDDVRDQINQTLTAQRADQQMDAWLKDARKRTHIVFHEEAFE
ncbi:MAG: hypothetical protein M3Z85_21660 [Acidobacteriota bacterium]|nr:hypothetical protein [Acidobacteriota bacterium]